MGKKNKGHSQAQDLIPNEKVADSEKDLQPSVEGLEGEIKSDEGTKDPEAEKKDPKAPKEKKEKVLNGTPRINKLNNLKNK